MSISRKAITERQTGKNHGKDSLWLEKSSLKFDNKGQNITFSSNSLKRTEGQTDIWNYKEALLQKKISTINLDNYVEKKTISTN